MHRFRPAIWLRAHPRSADAILAGVLTFLGVGAHWNAPIPEHGHAPNAVGTILVCLAAAPIAFRRVAPIAVLAAIALAEYAVGIVGFPNSGWLSLMVALYTVAAHTNGAPRARAARVFAATTLIVLGSGLIARKIDAGDLISSIVFLIGAFVLGDNLQRRRQNAAEMAEKIERGERERELLAQQRTQEERSRIARELHDVVAHSVSLMIIQAGAARRSMSTAPEQSEVALRNLESTGRQAMDELRRILGVLRTPDVESGELAPQPSLGQVRDLVEGDPSLPISFAQSGSAPADIPPSIELSLYRVVQEALTNVRKHAGAVRRVDVRIAYEPQEIVVQVIDDGRGASVENNAEGHGLVGMRERMALCGGTVTAGPNPGGGWAVKASAPLAGHGAGSSRAPVAAA